MGQKDKTGKLLFDYNDVFADILNGLVFRRQEVKETDLETTGTESVYKAVKSLHGMLDVPEELKPFVPDYRINVIDVAFLDENIRQRFRSDFKIIADFFYEKRVCGADFTPSDDRIRHVREMLDFLAAFADDEEYRRLGDALVSDAGKGKEVTMCTVLQSYLQKGLAQGREEGREEGRAAGRSQMIASMLKAGVPKKQIYDCGVTEEEMIAAERKIIL